MQLTFPFYLHHLNDFIYRISFEIRITNLTVSYIVSLLVRFFIFRFNGAEVEKHTPSTVCSLLFFLSVSCFYFAFI